MNKYTAQGKTVDEAVQIALNALGISKDDANVDVLEEGRRGFLGIGQRDAVVSVEKKAIKEEAIEQTIVESLFVEDAKEEQTFEKEEVAVETKTEVKKEVVVEEEPEERDAEDIAAQDQKAIEDVRIYIETIVEALDQKGEDVYVEVEQEDSYIYYDIHSDHPGIVIGRHGKVLESIHTLAQIYLHNEAASKLFVEVDTENYRGRRENSLRYLARESAEKALEQNQPVVLEDLSGKERKVIHRILSQNDKIKTYSKGKDADRFLVVEPRYENID